MTTTEAIAHMQTSTSFVEWHINKRYIIEHCPNYSDFWYQSIVMSGIMWDTIILFKDTYYKEQGIC